MTQTQQRPDSRIDVPKVLSQEQIQSYLENGYLVVPNVISPRELQELKADTIRVARGHYPCPSLKPVPAHLSDKDVLQSILALHMPHYISPVMRKYINHPTACGILSQICGAHLPFWDGSVKCMQSMLFVKPPGFQGQAWHQDEIYIPTRDRSLVGAWIAIDDATIENGCLWVVPGSQKKGYLYPQRAHNNDDEFDFAPESWGFEMEKEVPVEVKAGTMVFFNGYLLHRSKKNRSQIFRQVLVNHYCNAWTLLPWGPESTNAASGDYRVIIPVAGIDPYAWKGIKEPEAKDCWIRTCKASEEAKTAITAAKP